MDKPQSQKPHKLRTWLRPPPYGFHRCRASKAFGIQEAEVPPLKTNQQPDKLAAFFALLAKRQLAEEERQAQERQAQERKLSRLKPWWQEP
jgi:hypothetical protein